MPRARLDQLTLQMADAIGGLIEFWGFRRHMGRAWAVLYFSPEPLSATQLQDRLSLSAGAISMTMNDLLKWGVVKKTHKPGERRDYYEPETSIWKMVSRVFRERELAQIQVAIDAFESAIAELELQLRTSDAKTSERLRYLLERVEGLLAIARIGDKLLRAILSGESVSALPLAQFALDDE